MSDVLSNIISDKDRKTIAIIMGVFVPGAGHILMGLTRRGIIIVISAVLLGYISSPLVSTLTRILEAPAFHLVPFNSSMAQIVDTAFGLINSISPTIVPAIIWIWQLKDLLKITK